MENVSTWVCAPSAMEGNFMSCFIDFETSSQSADSWPIEVGLATIVGNETRVWGSLIRPSARWNIKNWNPGFQKSHGIEFEDLQKAPAPADVVGQLIMRMKPYDYTAYTRQPETANKLVELLLSGHSSCQQIKILSIDDLLRKWGLTVPNLERINRYFQRTQNVPRAELRAATLAFAFKTGGCS
ncbi:hypothetical protein [Parasedimentitalea huanghaiensis]|uniref:Exonuclease domain-containing protein n=1 Tax=Parasedimentitalea huanghaiensis TaxID=2682100 RepID=A0A6L6WR20_9RHOB|nr:hypothetical protein [Zongyanglinia huanghaiensis]MVO18377.1 hypothetical protein [Zongyanglinia huanghaiensis]